MNCTACKDKACRQGKDCFDVKDKSKKEYSKSESQQILRNAALLVDGGRAGQLSRVEEVLEFIQNNNYQKIGIAFCYGLEKYASAFCELLKQNNIKYHSVSCTVGGIKEREIRDTESTGIACNPAGQAEALMKSGCDFVVEMGLCLGHDVLFHRHLKCDFTVLAVKDRKFRHCPLKHFEL